MRKKLVSATAALTLGALSLTACGSADGGSTATGDGENVTITWWHNSNSGEGKDYYDQVAQDFMADHPGLTIDVSAMQHEDMGTKLDAAMQSGDMPDVFMERGGGELRDKVKAGLVKDITDQVRDELTMLGGQAAGWQVDGQTYALPFSLGVVGFWYNKDLFEQAGVTDTPTTWDEFYAVLDKLKAADITPISVGAGDKWPAAHYWYYFALRQCSEATIKDSVQTLEFSDECWIEAGRDLEELVATEPFNPGFLTTPAQSGATSASGLLATGKVSMELAGHWEPGVMQGLTEDNLGLGDATGWFAFPEVVGGAGAPNAALGGGDAWAASAKAPDVAVDFIAYLLSDSVQSGFAELDMGLPTNPAARDSLSDPALAALLDVRDKAPFVQLYFDTEFGQSIGGAMNDAIALMFAGRATPEDIVAKTQAAADAEK